MNLFDIAMQHKEARQFLINSDLDAQTISDTIDGMSGALEGKLDSICSIIKDLDAESIAISAEVLKMQKRVISKGNKIDALKAYVLSAMQAGEIQHVETARNIIAIVKNPPSVTITDELSVPSEFIAADKIIKGLPDKKKIKAYIESLEDGSVCGFAEITQSCRLQVK